MVSGQLKYHNTTDNKELTINYYQLNLNKRLILVLIL